MANPENLKGHEFKKGQSGNPKGRPAGSISLVKQLQTLLDGDVDVDVFVGRDDEGNSVTERMNAQKAIALKLVQSALNGDLKAIQDIFDHIDGKPIQRTENKDTSEHDNWVMAIQKEISDDS